MIEGLSAHAFGAVLIVGEGGKPLGVISKTDLMIAFHHNISPEKTAASIMSTPAATCSRGEFLINALKLMLVKDIQRLFVHDEIEENIIGVLSLSDAAQFRSGTCRACLPSRFITKTG